MPPTAPSAWLFGPRLDLLLFPGTVLGSLAFVGVARALGGGGATPAWAWLLLVVGIDVAHVWSTAFRVYLDRDELRRRRALYLGTPVVAWLGGVLLHLVSAEAFWRALAYVAVWHFVRQQVGWMRLYGRRAGEPPGAGRLDEAAIYAATLGPVVWWHANLPRPYWWFVEGDFVAVLPSWVGTVALVVHALVLGAWGVSTLRSRRVHAGKAGLLAATWVAWFGGIVLAPDDLTFTVLNVALHGVPYGALLYQYARGRAAEGGYAQAVRRLLGAGVFGFIPLLLAFAYAEELAWDWLVWHERPGLFGPLAVELSALGLAVAVPLLTVPQATHYVLDAFVWRTRDDPGLVRRLGWRA